MTTNRIGSDLLLPATWQAIRGISRSLLFDLRDKHRIGYGGLRMMPIWEDNVWSLWVGSRENFWSEDGIQLISRRQSYCALYTEQAVLRDIDKWLIAAERSSVLATAFGTPKIFREARILPWRVEGSGSDLEESMIPNSVDQVWVALTTHPNGRSNCIPGISYSYRNMLNECCKKDDEYVIWFDKLCCRLEALPESVPVRIRNKSVAREYQLANLEILHGDGIREPWTLPPPGTYRVPLSEYKLGISYGVFG